MATSLPANFLRVKKLWFFVFISGLLHLYLGWLYLTQATGHPLWLSKVFVLASIANGISTIIYFWVFFGSFSWLNLAGSLYDIALGLALWVLPYLPENTLSVFGHLAPAILFFFLPFYLAGGLLLQGFTQLIQYGIMKEEQHVELTSFRWLGVAKILTAWILIGFSFSSTNSLWLTSAAIMAAGVVNLVLAARLKTT